MNETTQSQYSTLPTLYIAFELSNKKWKLGFTIGLGQRPRERSIDAGDLLALEKEICRAKERFRFPVRGEESVECGERAQPRG